MIKCGVAMNDLPECGKDICCCYCEFKESCGFVEPSCMSGSCSDQVYVPDEIVKMGTGMQTKLQEVTDVVVQMKKAEEKITEIKTALLKAMEENGIKKFENQQVSFTYVAPTMRKTLDKTKLKKEHPELDLDLYQKESKVSASIRIQVK